MSSLGLLLRSIEKGVFSGTWLVFRCLEIRPNLSLGAMGMHRNRLRRSRVRCGAMEASVTEWRGDRGACWCCLWACLAAGRIGLMEGGEI